VDLTAVLITITQIIRGKNLQILISYTSKYFMYSSAILLHIIYHLERDKKYLEFLRTSEASQIIRRHFTGLCLPLIAVASISRGKFDQVFSGLLFILKILIMFRIYIHNSLSAVDYMLH
jgi:hypothetical protein